MGDARQRVLITAGASGIGLAIARTFVSRGSRCIACDIDDAAITKAGEDNPGITFLRSDVSDYSQVRALVAEAHEALGGIDVLINNAGIAGPRGPIEDNDPDEWAQCFNVNVGGAFHLIKSVVPIMRWQGGGSIINISTASTQTGLPHRCAYVASKWALEGLTKNAARELGPSQIRVNAIRPGFMNNPRMAGLLEKGAKARGVSVEEFEAEALSFISMRTKIEPAEIGEMAFFLASEQARHVTGQIIAVDGNAEWEG